MKQGWIDDARLAEIPREKLERLKYLADSTDATDRTHQMQILTAMIRNPDRLKLNFTRKETDLLMSVLKEYASPKELNMLSQAMRMFHKSSY